VLGGICSIYRGPLVVVGTRSGVAGESCFPTTRSAVPYLYALWLGPTVMQGSIDPNHSWTLWTSAIPMVAHGQFLRPRCVRCLMVVAMSAIGYYMLGLSRAEA